VHAADGKLGFLNDFVHHQRLDERKVSSNDFPWTLTFTLCVHNIYNQNPNLTAWFTMLLDIYWVWKLVTCTNEINGVDENACTSHLPNSVISDIFLFACECFTPFVFTQGSCI
jgi:hypothetical protein